MLVGERQRTRPCPGTHGLSPRCLVLLLPALRGETQRRPFLRKSAHVAKSSSDPHARSSSMGVVNTITKTVMTIGLVSGPIMLAAGLALIEECPAALIKGNGGTGADKGDWGTAPSAGSWPQTVISPLAKGAWCACSVCSLWPPCSAFGAGLLATLPRCCHQARRSWAQRAPTCSSCSERASSWRFLTFGSSTSCPASPACASPA